MINKVLLLGNLGNDPEIRYLPGGGTAVCELRIATSRKWTGKDGTKHDETEWHSVIVYGRQAELCKEYLSKGRQAFVEGRLKTRSWDDKTDGKKRYKTEIIADSVQFIGGRGGGGGGGGGAPSGGAPSGGGDFGGAPPDDAGTGGGGGGGGEDDIPF